MPVSKRPARVVQNRSRYAFGETPNCVTKTRRSVSVLPKPAMRVASVTVYPLSNAARAASDSDRFPLTARAWFEVAWSEQPVDLADAE